MLNETIAAGLNNPDCAFYVGAFMGQVTTGKVIIAILVLYVITRALDKLALEPTLQWLKKKFYKSTRGGSK